MNSRGMPRAAGNPAHKETGRPRRGALVREGPFLPAERAFPFQILETQLKEQGPRVASWYKSMKMRQTVPSLFAEAEPGDSCTLDLLYDPHKL